MEKLQNDRQVELYEYSFLDAVNYSGIKIIGIYHDIDDKVIILHLNGKYTRNKIRYNGERAYFISYGMRFYLDNFLPA